jgi:hypothetical protein
MWFSLSRSSEVKQETAEECLWGHIKDVAVEQREATPTGPINLIISNHVLLLLQV